MPTRANENYFLSLWELLHHLICLCNQWQHELDPPFSGKDVFFTVPWHGSWPASPSGRPKKVGLILGLALGTQAMAPGTRQGACPEGKQTRS